MTGEKDDNGQHQDHPANKTSPGEQPSGPVGTSKPEMSSTDPGGPSDESAGATSASAADPLDEAGKEPALLAAQLDELKSKLQLAYADIQNLHKRFERERSDIAKYAISKFAQDIVVVADNFERAITSVPEGAASQDAVFQSLLDGVTMTEREFLNALERHGVKRVNPEGEIFDPHHHQAMMEQDDTSVPHGTILQVYQQAYLIDDRVLRPAMVVVAKGGPKPAKTDKNAQTEPPAPPPPAANAAEPPPPDLDATEKSAETEPSTNTAANDDDPQSTAGTDKNNAG